MALNIVIVGAGGHGRSVANVAKSSGYSVVAYGDDEKAGGDIFGDPIVSMEDCLIRYGDARFAIAIGDNAIREKVRSELESELVGCKFPSLIHKSAVIGVGAVIGSGSVIMPLVNVGPNTIVGDFCILNSSASVDHDCEIEDYASVGPGALCGGGVRIGVRASVSMGAVVNLGVRIGNDTVIGANSYVHRSIAPRTVAYGTPCVSIRSREKGSPYLS